MDPDLVRQQEEAEREALAAIAKTALASRAKNAAPRTTEAHAFFNEATSISHQEQFALSASKLPHSGSGPVHADLRAGYQPNLEPAFARMGRLMSFGLAGGMLGGGFGIAAANWWGIPREQLNLAIFGPAGALAVFCAIASFFSGRSPDHRSGAA